MKRLSVLITNKNNEKIQKFRTDFINETKENMSYAEALNWLLNFGASTWFREIKEDFRKRFYKMWVGFARHRKYEEDIDAFDVFEYIQKIKERKNQPSETR